MNDGNRSEHNDTLVPLSEPMVTIRTNQRVAEPMADNETVVEYRELMASSMRTIPTTRNE